MTTLRFTLTFRTPFAVTSGHTSDGLDARVDRTELLPASSLKGLMRAEGQHVLGITDLTEQVFGGGDRRHPSAWAWSDGDVVDPVVDRRGRVAVDGEGRAREGSLLMAELVWATTATFTVTRLTPLDRAARDRHVLLLRACARSVTSLGAARRRGQGWVSIVDDDEWTLADSEALIALRKEQEHA